MAAHTTIAVNVPEGMWPWLSEELPADLRDRFECRPHGLGAKRSGHFTAGEASLIRMAVLRTERSLLTEYGRREGELADRCSGIAARIDADLRVAGLWP